MDVMVLLTISAALYFLPLVIALAREHPQAGAISLLNLLLGWTLLGWVGALIWACIAYQTPRHPVRVVSQQPDLC
jgi:Superinfection immunity protein